MSAHEGPAAPAEMEYLVREVAESLVSLGRGMTYTDAAKRVRMSANYGKTGEHRQVVGGQTVAEWMADFVPVVTARHQETEWPPVLVLDSTRFLWTNSRTKTTHDLFSVLAAYGYDDDGSNGRLLKLWASPTSDAAAWDEFLALLPGRPLSVVCDRDLGIIGAVKRRWGAKEGIGVPIHICEYHLLERGRKVLHKDGVSHTHPVWPLLHASLQTRAGWDAFESEVLSDDHMPATQKWVLHWQLRMRAQTARRATIPPVYGNGAVEAPVAQVRKVLESRRWTFRNRARMNLLLELVRMADLRADNATHYATAIRQHMATTAGRPTRTYRDVYDTWGPKGEQTRSYSLWSTPAEKAAKDLRNKARKAVGGDRRFGREAPEAETDSAVSISPKS